MIPGEILTPDGTIELSPAGTASRWPSRTPATGRSRSARTTISPRRTRRCPSTARAARGYRLDIPAGTSVRFEPGVSREVSLVALAGARVVPGLRPESAGPLDG